MILQRKPIDVNASVGCGERTEVIYDTTAKLLERAYSLRPHVGAVIRNAVPGARSLHETDKFTFMEPIQRATELWWRHRQTVTTTPDISQYEVRWRDTNPQLSEYNCEGHYDQKVGLGGRPSFGPLTVGLVLEGVIDYKLAVKRANPFVIPPQIFNIMVSEAEGEAPRRTDTIVGTQPGDIVMFTNTPPTWHEVRSQTGEKLTATFFSDFVQCSK